MALYSNSAFRGTYKKAVKQGTQVEPNYLFGNFDFNSADYEFQISQVALTSNVATVTVQLVRGGGGTSPNTILPLPVVGAHMGVQGTASNSGLFNVDPATITAVSINASGAGTISYACTGSNVTATADSGKLVVWPYEYPDLISSGTASIPIALSFMPDESDNSRCFFAECVFPSLPTSATVVMQAANVDIDSRY